MIYDRKVKAELVLKVKPKIFNCLLDVLDVKE